LCVFDRIRDSFIRNQGCLNKQGYLNKQGNTARTETKSLPLTPTEGVAVGANFLQAVVAVKRSFLKVRLGLFRVFRALLVAFRVSMAWLCCSVCCSMRHSVCCIVCRNVCCCAAFKAVLMAFGALLMGDGGNLRSNASLNFIGKQCARDRVCVYVCVRDCVRVRVCVYVCL